MSMMKSEHPTWSGVLIFRLTPWGFKHVSEKIASSPAEAVALCMEDVVKKGWQCPRVWQWWRRHEAKEPWASEIML